MVRDCFVFLCFLLTAQIIASSADPSRTRDSHETRKEGRHGKDNVRHYKKQTRIKVQGKAVHVSKPQSKENDNYVNLEDVLFDREQLKKYVLDYLRKHHHYDQVEKTITNDEEESFSRKRKQSATHNHERLESKLSSVNAKHKQLDHDVNENHKRDHSLHLQRSSHKRQNIVSKQKSHQSHNQHDHVEKHQRSKKMSLPIYYSVREDDGKRSNIWSYPSSFGHEGKKSKFRKRKKHSGHNKDIISRKSETRVKNNIEVHQKARKHETKANMHKLSSMRAFPNSPRHGQSEYKKDSGHKKEATKRKDKVKHKPNDAQKGKNEGKHSGHNKEISGTKRNARVEGHHKMHQKARKHKDNATKSTSLHALPYSRDHGKSENKKDTGHRKPTTKRRDKIKHKENENHKATSGLAHKKSNKRDFIAVVPPKALRIEGFNVERVHPHSSNNKKKTAISGRHKHIHEKNSKSHKKSGERTAGAGKRNIASKSHKRKSHVKKDEVRKKSQPQKEGRKRTVASKSHRNDNHGEKDRVQKEIQPQKSGRKNTVVIPRTSRNERKKTGPVPKSSRELKASRKSSVSTTSYKGHSHKHNHHDRGHKKSTVHKEEKSKAYSRKKPSRDKESKKFSPSWKSLDKREIPSWYDDAKFGIFVHWGLYSVPSFDSEWFWYKWKGRQLQQYLNYTEKNFPPGFSYNEFAPMFKAEFFDAKQWAELVARSGAR